MQPNPAPASPPDALKQAQRRAADHHSLLIRADAQARARRFDDTDPAGWPDAHTLIVQVREALGLFAGAMTASPQAVFEETLQAARAAVARSAS